jgi:hypothetical protein
MFLKFLNKCFEFVLPVEWHRFSVFVPEDEQDVVTGNGRLQVTSQLGRVADYHFRVDEWHCLFVIHHKKRKEF